MSQYRYRPTILKGVCQFPRNIIKVCVCVWGGGGGFEHKRCWCDAHDQHFNGLLIAPFKISTFVNKPLFILTDEKL